MSKPTKNRVMCPECFKAKMLFETQKQADNFIKWNGEDIDTHGGVLRSYYCQSCGGWHISSKPYKPVYEHNTENLIERYRKDKKNDIDTTLLQTEVEKLFGKLVEETPTFENPSKRFLKDYLDAYINQYKIELPKSGVDEFRHLVYKHYLN